MGKVKKPKCKLSETDGNVFFMAAKVNAALEKAGMKDKINEFSGKLFKCESYDAAIRLMSEYVEIR